MSNFSWSLFHSDQLGFVLNGNFRLIHIRDPSVDITSMLCRRGFRVTFLQLMAVFFNSVILLIGVCARFGGPRHRSFRFVMDDSSEAERICSWVVERIHLSFFTHFELKQVRLPSIGWNHHLNLGRNLFKCLKSN